MFLRKIIPLVLKVAFVFFLAGAMAASFFSFWRHGIVAAGKERIASEYAKQGQHRAFESAVSFDCFHCIGGAGWIVFAHRREVRRDVSAVKTDQSEKQLFHDLMAPTSLRPSSIASATWWLFRYLVFPLATKTRSQFVRS